MLWNWTTQSVNRFSVTLRDSAATYINAVARQNTNPLPSNSGGAVIAGDSLGLTIDCPNASTLSVVPTLSTILDPQGRIVGYQFLLVAEDATDADFNDIMVSIVSFRKRG